ncbi:hypothetical protein TUM20983_37590 [Mycobacterium antarcticum]|nr:hypothetical protein TUM20983_37590 [Mycolicibacterium sp. TUM20983]
MTKRKSPATRRLEILHAAGDIALTEGLEAVSNRRIAEHLSCAAGLIHHYFPVAMDLLAEALQQVLMADQNSCFGESEAEPDALTGLSTLLTRWGFHKSGQYAPLWLDAWSLARRQPQIRDVVDDVMKQGHLKLTALLQRGVDEGCFVADDAPSVAWYLLTTLDGITVHTSIGVNQGLIDVQRTVAMFTEDELGLAPGSLRIGRHT